MDFLHQYVQVGTRFGYRRWLVLPSMIISPQTYQLYCWDDIETQKKFEEYQKQGLNPEDTFFGTASLPHWATVDFSRDTTWVHYLLCPFVPQSFWKYRDITKTQKDLQHLLKMVPSLCFDPETDLHEQWSSITTFWHDVDWKPGSIFHIADRMWGMTRTDQIWKQTGLAGLILEVQRGRTKTFPIESKREFPEWNTILRNHTFEKVDSHVSRFEWTLQLEPWRMNLTPDYHWCLQSSELGGIIVTVRDRSVSICIRGGTTVFNDAGHKWLVQKSPLQYCPYNLFYTGHLDLSRTLPFWKKLDRVFDTFLIPLEKRWKKPCWKPLLQWSYQVQSMPHTLKYKTHALSS